MQTMQPTDCEESFFYNSGCFFIGDEMLQSRKRLGDLLYEAGLLTDAQLNKALSVHKKTGARLGRVLINLGYITEERMIEVLEIQLGMPHVNLENVRIPRDIAALIPESVAERYQVIPIACEGRFLTLAMADPTNFYAIDDVHRVSQYEVNAVIASEKEIRRLISESYGMRELVEKSRASNDT